MHAHIYLFYPIYHITRCYADKVMNIDPRRYFKCMSQYTVPHTTRPFRWSGCIVKHLPCVQSWEAVCTIFMMVFGMTWPGREPTNYRVRGRHANHSANPAKEM